ncbi:MAG: hypothetical protein A3B88_04530, partial [Candidatus Zambryskibacteria bacterium RIFCSPHIGHO2_02_FULL_39_19]
MFFLATLSRLFYWQIVKGEDLTAQADSQHHFTLSVPAARGDLLFSDQKPLVVNKEAFLLYANLPKIDRPKKEVADQLATILAGEIPLIATPGAQQLSPPEHEARIEANKLALSQKIEDKLNLPSAVWVNLAHFVNRDIRKKIDDLHLSGLDFASEETRDYPESSMAAHTVGFVASDQNGNPKGYFGLEGFYERELAGRPGEVRIEKDAFGRPIAIGAEERREKQDGSSLVLTLDRSVQLFAERNLEKGVQDWKAAGGTAIVMDPNDGRILALANLPKYDPANFSYYETALYKNPAIANLYEPGSILKPLVMAAAISEGKVTPETRCDQRCNGPREIGGLFIHTFNNQYHPNLTMTEVLVNSDNTGMVFVGETLGFDKFYSSVQKYGFGQKTGVDLPEEEEGSLRRKQDFYPVDKATLTFGQGISVNALQMARAFSALANGGHLVSPHLVSQIDAPTGPIAVAEKPGPQVISSIAAQTVTEMLIQVCEKSPTHFPRDRIPELFPYRIACKSGTAQIAVGGAYKEKGTTASVIGFFPANKPKYLVYVKLVE